MRETAANDLLTRLAPLLGSDSRKLLDDAAQRFLQTVGDLLVRAVRRCGYSRTLNRAVDLSNGWSRVRKLGLAGHSPLAEGPRLRLTMLSLGDLVRCVVA